MNYLRNKIQHHFHNPNYLALLVSLVILIVIPPFAALFTGGLLLLEIAYGLVILMSAVYASKNFREMNILLVIGGIMLYIFILQSKSLAIGIFGALLSFAFFTTVFSHLIEYILKSKTVTANDVFASIAGYLILGIIGTTMFILIHNYIPNSFNVPINTNYHDFIYFSYITITTVGFGDISPIHPIAKSVTVLLGIAGQLYLTVLVGIIIGKYLVKD